MTRVVGVDGKFDERAQAICCGDGSKGRCGSAKGRWVVDMGRIEAAVSVG